MQILHGQCYKGNMKYPCIYCLFDARSNERYEQFLWPYRSTPIPGEFNVVHRPLISSENVILPILHIKLGIFKQFAKYIDHTGEAFQRIVHFFQGLYHYLNYFLMKRFLRISIAKVSNGVLTGPQINSLFRDEQFLSALSGVEFRAFSAMNECFMNVLTKSNLLFDQKRILVNNLVAAFEQINANFSPKMHYLVSHIDKLLDDDIEISDQHGEKFHQTLLSFENRYCGKSYEHMLSDYVWSVCK